jgi:hypothetical protein
MKRAIVADDGCILPLRWLQRSSQYRLDRWNAGLIECVLQRKPLKVIGVSDALKQMHGHRWSLQAFPHPECSCGICAEF